MNLISPRKEKPSHFCPQCGSTELEDYAGFVSGQFKCKKCGFIGTPVYGDYNLGNELQKNFGERK